MKIKESSFTIFDFETTGLYPYSGDRICEIGAIRLSAGNEEYKQFHSLINPGRPISYGAFMVNKITYDMIQDKPTIGEILPDFLRFIQDSVLVAYNSGFDLGFLDFALLQEGLALDEHYTIDALRLARRFFPGIGRYNLVSVANTLGITIESQHRALSDAMATTEIFKAQLKHMSNEGIETVSEIGSLLTLPRGSKEAMTDSRLKMIQEAIRLQAALIIVYRSSWNGAISQRVIIPKKIKRGFDRTYIIAHCHLKNEERNFRLDCIESVNRHINKV